MKNYQVIVPMDKNIGLDEPHVELSVDENGIELVVNGKKFKSPSDFVSDLFLIRSNDSACSVENIIRESKLEEKI